MVYVDLMYITTGTPYTYTFETLPTNTPTIMYESVYRYKVGLNTVTETT